MPQLFRNSGADEELPYGLGKGIDFRARCGDLPDDQLENTTEYQTFLATERHDQQERIVTLFSKKKAIVQIPGQLLKQERVSASASDGSTVENIQDREPLCYKPMGRPTRPFKKFSIKLAPNDSAMPPTKVDFEATEIDVAFAGSLQLDVSKFEHAVDIFEKLTGKEEFMESFQNCL